MTSAPDSWNRVVPSGSSWHNEAGECETRRELVRDLRALADFLETRPDVPVPRHAYLPLNVFAAGTETDMRAQVDYAASLLQTTGESRGDQYVAEKAFGNASYRYVAIPPPASPNGRGDFAIGQDVRVASDTARDFSQHCLPLAGVVMSRVEHGTGAVLYQVRLTGGQRTYFTPTMLEPLRFEPVATTHGRVSGLGDAEATLVGALARCEFHWQAGRQAWAADTADVTALGSALARACGLPRDRLCAALDGKVAREVDKLRGAGRAATREAAAAPGAARRSPSAGSMRSGLGR